jgi:hypothetical protein
MATFERMMLEMNARKQEESKGQTFIVQIGDNSDCF